MVSKASQCWNTGKLRLSEVEGLIQGPMPTLIKACESQSVPLLLQRGVGGLSVLVLPFLTRCVTLGKLLPLSELELPSENGFTPALL